MENNTYIEVIKGRLIISNSERLYITAISDIERCESHEDNSQIFLKNGTNISVTTSLNELEEQLKMYPFFRIHQDHLINTNYLEKYDHFKQRCVILNGGVKLPVDPKQTDQLLEFLGTIGINIITD